MNKTRIIILLFLLSLSLLSGYSQQNNTVITNNVAGSNIFHHTIERGQTVYSIATMYGVSEKDIYRLNPGSEESIKAGAILIIPQKGTSSDTGEASDAYTYHTIQPKETLYSLTLKYNIPATRIVDANPGLSVETFTIGKTIRIPATNIDDLPTTEIKTVTKEIEYRVKRRETMYSICRRFNVSSSELIKRNPELKNGMKTGMTIKIPIQAEETVTTTVEQLQERDVNALLSTPKEIDKVNVLKVAVLLPFMADGNAGSDAALRTLEYYEGFLLAIDSLKNQGISVSLSVYDIGEGTKKTKDVLKNKELKEANLILGGVQNDQIKLIADFAKKQEIKYVIPFTSRNDDVLSNNYVFQVNTPHSYLYAKAAQAGCRLFGEYNIILINTNDSKNKTDYIKALKTEMELRNLTYTDYNLKSETFSDDLLTLLDSTKRNVVIPYSGTLEALNKIRIPLKSISESNPEYGLTLYGYPEWQTYMRECLDDFFALNTYIYSNFYVDNISKEARDFHLKYRTWFSKSLFNSYPKYGILGFDTAMYFLTSLYKNGTNFEDNPSKINYNGIQTSFDLHRVNNWGGFVNTHLFLVHYRSDFTITREDVNL
ncbi:LysM peptidoglycan-binding domain-containing protein [Massilibacteroides sp.]|uniref:PBP1 and LysM peptidoglycan-binding domain-containing protein n=1 Tax=Massilibacteroides sp. TaxID=2034766 RepID=UPI002632DE10|nr:LysM peptidoglycan-binding domain-containing protein [Massilibacteroides sp.]MDD4515091.1 LysM peptidoglycan-binding domain-containing protein [Massilibacteroides sp.]